MPKIIGFSSEYVPQAKRFTDRWIGEDYYSEADLEATIKVSQKDGLCSSLILVEGEKILGVRLTYPPGQWLKLSKPGAITPQKWSVDPQDVAYFKSLFVDESVQSSGYGKQLSDQSLEILKKMGARAVVCHSWKESPGDSSRRYLRKMGFEEVSEQPLFWHDIPYQCSGCHQPKCTCTAIEMIKYL